ncbi:hypothetical protein XENORESO_015936 [Xenotaenia resolanae]|uniref:Uncharacterized protein n=1 Tax=Xenotaenia resolanae TaxID=208358 RepID=A0ABV0X142_9TELE
MGKRKKRSRMRRGGLVRGWYQRCCGLNEFLWQRRGRHFLFPRWQCEDEARSCLPCLSGTQTLKMMRQEGGIASSEVCQALGLTRNRHEAFWSVTRGLKNTPSVSDRSF